MLKKIKKFILSKNFLIVAIIILLVLFILFFLLRKTLIVATVNGQPINRLELINELEKQSGKKTLDSMITKTLILQEAQKKNININQTDVDNQLKTIETNLAKQGATLDQALQSQGMTKSQLNEQIKLQLMLQKLVGGNIIVSDKEIADFIKTNKSQFPANSDDATLKKQAEQQIKQQKQQQKIQDYVTQLNQKAKIVYFINF